LHITYVCISVTGDAMTGSGSPPPSFADAPGLLTVDNHVTWIAVTHSGIVIRSVCEIQVDATNFNGAGIFYAGDASRNPVSDVNGSICRSPFVSHCGVGISIVGGDSNTIQFYGGELGALGTSSDGFPGVGGCGIYDRSFGGCRFFGITIETPAQRGIRSQSDQGSMYYGCHTEAGLPDHMGNSAVFGGTAIGFTTNSINMLVDTTLGGIQNLTLTATTKAKGVTTSFQQASNNSTSVDTRTTTDDQVGLYFSTEYGQIGSGYLHLWPGTLPDLGLLESSGDVITTCSKDTTKPDALPAIRIRSPGRRLPPRRMNESLEAASSNEYHLSCPCIAP
jgi:hypothetical protein